MNEVVTVDITTCLRTSEKLFVDLNKVQTMSKLKGRVALVTGASKGIGAGIAKELAAAGAAVVVNYATDQSGAEAVVNEITKTGGQAIAVAGDVSKSTDVTRLFVEINTAYGALDIVVNNAGVYNFGPVDSITEEEFHRQFNTNVLGPLLVIRESLKYFGPTGGSVINIGSGSSRRCPPNQSIYAPSKAALDAITGVVSKDLATRKIRVNSINPGATLSEGARAAGMLGNGSEIERQLIAMTPLGRIGMPSDIAKVVVFLASVDSGWLTGEIIHASGGL
jgi:3-oxoacyl-[acyl-carrier protein] reductase